ncbi:MAG: DUF4105 domain-containing protein [Nitrococcus sp.]|nr:DUF4105 domain-containing protein [Nitrococcus sp.]
MRLRLAVFLLLAGLSAAPRTGAQPPITLSAQAELSLLTILPGHAIYSMYGHSALRVHDPKQRIDWVYNYGTFSFKDSFFVGKFLYGNLRYRLSVAPYRLALLDYLAQGRPVIEQTLNLTPAQEDALFRFLQINYRPRNRHYRYNFLFDNCSTRIRDALKTVLGERLHFAAGSKPPATFRHLLDPYGSDYLNTGEDLLLGLPVDQLATPWQMMFLPDYLMRGFAHARVLRGTQAQPLVAHTQTVLDIAGYERAGPAPFPPMLLGWLVSVVGVLATYWSYRRQRVTRRLADALFLALVGIAGLLITFLMFFSLHEATEYNLNLLWAWPTHLWAAVALLRGRRRRFLRRYLLAAAGVSLILAVGWMFWPQELPSALLPIVLLLALRCVWQAYAIEQRTPAPAPSG